MRKYIQALARLIRRTPQPPQASVAVGDIIACGALVGRVQALQVNEGGTVDAVIMARDANGVTYITELPADGRYDIELDVIQPADAISRGILFRRWATA